jgi:hypothetical protein
MLPLGQLWHSATLRGLVGWLQLRIELLGNFHVGHRQEVTQKVSRLPIGHFQRIMDKGALLAHLRSPQCASADR